MAKMILLSKFINSKANKKNLILFIGLYLLFSVGIWMHAKRQIKELADKPIGIIDATFGFNPQKTLNLVANYGDSARAYYEQVELSVDVVYPIVYAFLFGFILSLLYKNSPLNWINVLPFVSLLLDYAENIHIVILLHNFPKQSYTIAVLCEIFKLLKWISLGIVVLFILYGFLKKINTRKNSI